LLECRDSISHHSGAPLPASFGPEREQIGFDILSAQVLKVGGIGVSRREKVKEQLQEAYLVDTMVDGVLGHHQPHIPLDKRKKRRGDLRKFQIEGAPAGRIASPRDTAHIPNIFGKLCLDRIRRDTS
jgi:hypothetical protein